MVISSAMAAGFSYTMQNGWTGGLEARRIPLVEELLPHQLLLLFSEGSMTTELELLSNDRVEAEVRFNGPARLSRADADFLGASPDDPAIEREVWLNAGEKRLLYARTLIPVAMLDPFVKAALDEKGSEPLGRVLASNGILFAKERLEIGVVRCPVASRDLDLPEHTPLFARRYILFNKGERGWIIKAAVTEIFSPGLLSAGLTN